MLFAGIGAALYAIIPSSQAVEPGTARNEVTRKIYTTQVENILRPSNSFLEGCIVDNVLAPGGDPAAIITVDIPQSTTDVESQIAPTVFPMQASEAVDSTLSYPGYLIATRPNRVGDLNQAQVVYDKVNNTVQKHAEKLLQDSAELILHAWCPTQSGLIIPTTGANRLASGTGATGNRKKITEADILSLKLLFDNANVPLAGRRLLVNGTQENDLLAIERFTEASKYGPGMSIMTGEIGMVHGFRVIKRSEVQSYASDGTRKAFRQATATNDNAAALAYHPNFVRYIKGNVKVYLDSVSRGEYLGKLMNAAVYAGGSQSRSSQIGVAALYEAAGA